MGGGPQSYQALLCLVAGGLFATLARSSVLTFSASSSLPKTRAPLFPLQPPRYGLAIEPRASVSGHAIVGAAGVADAHSTKGVSSLSLFGCGAALFFTAAAARAARVAMHSQGQGGRYNLGQRFMPRAAKGAKKWAVFRKKKNYGSADARWVPRRYELYDLLEELDKSTPWYTVISEPEVPKEPVFDVPLDRRYPWADPFKVHPKKFKLESSKDRLEPLFGNFTTTNLPPIGRRQNYIERRGWPKYHYPPWLNRPLVGTGIRFDKAKFNKKDLAWSKDRRPPKWLLGGRARKALEREQREKKLLRKAEAADFDDDDVDDLEADLEALEAA